MTAASMTVRHAAPPLPDAAVRVRMAADPSTAQVLLRQLADDPDVLVRAAVAMNPSAAPGVDRLLLADEDDRVRALLGRKMAALMPGLSSAEQSQAYAHVQATLTELVADEAVRVRAAVADALKAMPEAPRELILRLAHDHAVPVSDPVIRLSPLLTDADLLALLATPPNRASASAVAGRAGLSAMVANAVAGHMDSAAVRVLLSNQSATIQEATLDALVGRAAEHPGWHEPLVRRSALSSRSAVTLSGMLAGQLLASLLLRADLDETTKAELQGRVAARLRPGHAPERGAAHSDDELFAAMRRLDAAGALNENAFLEAARTGDARRVAAMLAVAAGLSLAMVDRAVSRRSAKALVSLAWKAGFTMRAGTAALAVLDQAGASSALTPADGGAFPLSIDEMQWQIEVLNDAGR